MEGDTDMSIVLMIVATLAVVFGAFSLSQATMGVGIITIGCFIAILARLAQAYQQHREVMRLKDSQKQ